MFEREMNFIFFSVKVIEMEIFVLLHEVYIGLM